MTPSRPLNKWQLRFCEEYVIDLNATDAYTRAGYKSKNKKSAGAASARLLADGRISARIAELQKLRGERTETDADMVVKQWRAIALADPNDLMEFRRVCCRHCYGEGHRYQRTPAEREAAFAAHVAKHEKKDELPLFDEMGGVGFNATLPPVPQCPECFGEGEGKAYFKDTRELPIPARLLYGGVKVTKEGIEVRINSKEKALEMLARHNGMLVDRGEVSGPGGAPIAVQHSGELKLTPSEAYMAMLGGK